jgi:hypothetical protein
VYDGTPVAEAVRSLSKRRPFVVFHLVLTDNVQIRVASPESAWLGGDGELIYATQRDHTYIVPSAKVLAVSVATQLPRGE